MCLFSFSLIFLHRGAEACFGRCAFFLFKKLAILMIFLWRVREALGRCLSEGHIACGISQDTCPMIMFMNVITGLRGPAEYLL